MCLEYHQKMDGMRLLETKTSEKNRFLAARHDFLNYVYTYAFFSIAGMEQNSTAPFMERLGKNGENHAANSIPSNFWGSFFN